MERRTFLKLGAAAGTAFVMRESGIAVPAYAAGETAERPTGVPVQAGEVATQVAEIPYASNFVREGGNAWRTPGKDTVVTGPFTPEEGVPYILGNKGEAGNIDVELDVRKGWLLWTSFGHGTVELPECGMRWEYAYKGNDHEAKQWFVMAAPDCACPNDETEKVIISGVRKGHNRVMAWPLAHADGKGLVGRDQLSQYVESARKIGISDLSLRHYDRNTGAYTMLGANPQAGDRINFVDGNSPR